MVQFHLRRSIQPDSEAIRRDLGRRYQVLMVQTGVITGNAWVRFGCNDLHLLKFEGYTLYLFYY
jgi:hypothetical protein